LSKTSKPNLKDKSYNAISLAQDDDAVTVASLSSSEEEKFTFAAQPVAPQLVGTQSEKKYF